MDEPIVNRVANSGLITLDLELLHTPGERVFFDLSGLLYQQLVLREKEFRDFVKTHPWQQYQDQHVAIGCTADAIIPHWAYMLVSLSLQPWARTIAFGTLEQLEEQLYAKALATVDWESYRDAKVVVKGCSKVSVPVSAYVEATHQLRAVATSIFFGEPCSTVPLYKRAKANMASPS